MGVFAEAWKETIAKYKADHRVRSDIAERYRAEPREDKSLWQKLPVFLLHCSWLLFYACAIYTFIEVYHVLFPKGPPRRYGPSIGDMDHVLDMQPRRKHSIWKKKSALAFAMVLSSTIYMTTMEQIQALRCRWRPWEIIVIESLKFTIWFAYLARQCAMIDQADWRFDNPPKWANLYSEQWERSRAEGSYPAIWSLGVETLLVVLFFLTATLPLLCWLTPTTPQYTMPAIWRYFHPDSPSLPENIISNLSNEPGNAVPEAQTSSTTTCTELQQPEQSHTSQRRVDRFQLKRSKAQ